MRKIYSAPSSLILSGECSYQYGKPVLLCAVEDRVFIKVQVGNENRNRYSTQLLSEIYSFFKKKGIDYTRIPKEISFNISGPQLLNGEFALSTALMAGIFDCVAQKAPRETVHEFVYQSLKKKILADAESSVSYFGGLILYRKEFEFLKYISKMNMFIPRVIEKNLMYTPINYHLGKLRNKIDASYMKNPKKTEYFLMKNEKLTRRLVISFIKEDVRFFTETLNDFQTELESLDVVSEDVIKFCRMIRFLGGGVKIVFDSFLDNSKAFLLIQGNEKIYTQLKKEQTVFIPFQQAKRGLITHTGEIKSPTVWSNLHDTEHIAHNGPIHDEDDK